MKTFNTGPASLGNDGQSALSEPLENDQAVIKRGSPASDCHAPSGRLVTVDAALRRVNEKLHVFAAFALFGLAVLILVDVIARSVFSSPIAGTAEIVSNAIVAIAFLQLAHSIRSGGFLRVEMLDGVLAPSMRKALFVLACALGALLFGAVAWSSWGGMVDAWRIGEFDGVEGSIKVPTAPIRTIMVAASLLASFNFIVVLIRTLRFSEIETASEAA